MNKKYQVFISSTFIDLAEQRRKVSDIILRMGYLPVGMEQFNAADDSQWEIIKTHIDNSDYYILILAHRYGTEDLDGISYTEKEYDYALSQGVPCIAFIIEKNSNWKSEYIDKGKSFKKLSAFKNKFTNRLVNYWSTTEELAGNVALSLSSLITAKERTGWIRADKVTTSPLVAEEISRLSKENNELKALLASQNSAVNEVQTAENILKNIEVKSTLSGKQFDGSFLKIFSLLAPSLVAETSTQSLFYKLLELAFDLTTQQAVGMRGEELSNVDFYDAFLSKIVILGLATSSANPKRTNPLSNRIIQLTDLGKKLLVKIEHPTDK